MSGAPQVVVLGMMTKIPVAGVVWQTLHYLLGLRRLGIDAWYVEAHARTPSMLTPTRDSDGAAAAAAFVDRAMRGAGLGDRWAYQALHDDGRCYGMSERELLALYDRAELILNLHGGTAPRAEHARTGRLVYLETDPVQLQAELAQGVPATIEFLEQHCAFFTFGENWGAADCGLAPTARFHFHPTRQPVVLDCWPAAARTRDCFTTIGNWRQSWRDVTLDGRTYSWSKHAEFERILALPARTGRAFELALASCDEQDRARLRAHGWRVADAAALSGDVHAYRAYVSESLGELTVAKEQNVVLRSGWFSDRSATYLAAGRPVITQETGFSNVLPTGGGLHGFATLDEAAAAVEAVCADLRGACADARAIAREHFCSDVVLGDLLARCGVATPGRRRADAGAAAGAAASAAGSASGIEPRGALADDLPLGVARRRPLRLPADVHARIVGAPVPLPPAGAPARPEAETPFASVVVVSHGSEALTRLCVESVLADAQAPPYELIVVDNGSQDGSRAYLRTLARRFSQVRLILNERNRGFAAACNQALARARGELLVLLNNDAIVAPGWLARLAAHAAEPSNGLIGAVTNRIGNEAEVPVAYETYGGFVAEAAHRARAHAGRRFELPMPAMFCLALRRDVFDRLGPLDERFGPGLLEDDDYAERARRAGLRCVCAEDVLVHHFGEGSLGELFADGAHGELLAANRARFERKWGAPWQPYGRRQTAEYEQVRDRVRELVSALPADGAVIVASRGDEEILRFPDRAGWHFPQGDDGLYAGCYPADGAQAVAELERLRARGGRWFLLPKTSLWWLEHYRELGAHLSARYREVVREEACVMYALEEAR